LFVCKVVISSRRSTWCGRPQYLLLCSHTHKRTRIHTHIYKIIITNLMSYLIKSTTPLFEALGLILPKKNCTDFFFSHTHTLREFSIFLRCRILQKVGRNGRQETQMVPIHPKSTKQMVPIHPKSTKQMVPIHPKSTWNEKF